MPADLTKFQEDFKKARAVSVPLVAVETPDPASTMRSCIQVVQAIDKSFPILSWDVISGFRPYNDPAKAAIQKVLQERDPAVANNPAEALPLAELFPKGTMMFMLNGHRFIGEETTSEAAVGQAVWNLRDKFKQNERTLVLLSPFVRLPQELRQDVIVMEDPLPTPEELKGIMTKVYNSTRTSAPQVPPLDEKVVVRATETLRGLSAFVAEQTVAMAISSQGLNLEKLWEKKRKQVEQTEGLSVYRGKETYNDLRGVPVIKQYVLDLFSGNDAPTGIMFMDEIEKMFAGIVGDTSGSSQEQNGEFLRWSQDNKVPGLIFVGHPGCSKTFLAKCVAGELGVPMIEANFSAFKGSFVGQTSARTREGMRMILASMKPLMIATSNSLAILPPELRRRFKLGTFFFDLPTKDERDDVWRLYLKKYNIAGTDKPLEIPLDENWTPADIETCCNIAWRLKKDLVYASKLFVPVAQSNPDKIDSLRVQADGKFLSASYEGVYHYSKGESLADELDAVRNVTV